MQCAALFGNITNTISKDHSFIHCFHLFILLIQTTLCSALTIHVAIKEEIKETNRFSFRQEISVYSTTVPHRISCVQQQIYRMLGNRQHPCEAMSEKGPRLIHRYLKRSINPIKSSNASRSVSDLCSSAEYLLATREYARPKHDRSVKRKPDVGRSPFETPWINGGAHEPSSGRQSSISETSKISLVEYRIKAYGSEKNCIFRALAANRSEMYTVKILIPMEKITVWKEEKRRGEEEIKEEISLAFLYRLLLNNAFVDTSFVRSSPSLTYYVRATPNAIARYALLAAHYNYDNSPI
ncbi:hypothetical protein G5I_14394 [Acromyrmex echinatior]|uniref:Uncharacterized protein n=1 Tax=Acromyrmex echinatior TaxID=103372 RepID=F4X7L2_ACREC|nr:hypothetical protein G5I_14394 [Acromyrmex echinatior]